MSAGPRGAARRADREDAVAELRAPIRVLFLCTGNSCRSQMAEGWARALLSGQVEVTSAGTYPQGVNPFAVRASREAGADISGQQSRGLTDIQIHQKPGYVRAMVVRAIRCTAR